MGALTKIQWAHHTMNFWVGCTEVSPACDFCYAKKWADRAGRPELWQGERQRTTPANWKQPFKWNAAALAAGELTRVFVNSLSDFFDNQVDPVWRADAFDVMQACEDLQFLLLTKRPQNIPGMLKAVNGRLPSNVWLGTTVENQAEADRRIQYLLAVPAAVHFLSMEPLLESVDITHWLSDIDWVIVGGESGAKDRRPFELGWAFDLIAQCREAGTAAFVKQLGSHVTDEGRRMWLKDKKGGEPDEWPAGLFVRQFPKVKIARVES